MKTPNPVVFDFETLPIMSRPHYPPRPVGVSIKLPHERKPQYYAFGHPTHNNCTEAQAKAALKAAYKLARDTGCGMLAHHFKFDGDVAETHWGLKLLPALQCQDTVYLLFLNNPHALTLALKPSAEAILGLKPDERDAVALWLFENQKELKASGLLPPDERITMGNAGKWICLAPGNLVGKYANGDVTRTYKLFRKLFPDIVERSMLHAYQREQKLMPILLENERQGVRVDHNRLARDVKLYEAALEAADNWLRKTLKNPDLNINSDAELACTLDEQGIVTEWEYTKTGKRSTSKKNLKVEHFANKDVASVLYYRNKLSTCLGTFMRPWLITARQTNGRIHTDWSQVRQPGGGARTGRLSSSPNFQNIPTDLESKKDGFVHPTVIELPRLPAIRGYVIPDEGHILCGRDFASQELRVLAHYVDGAMVEAYNGNPELDLHQFASDLITQTTGIQVTRSNAKIVAFSIIYGSGIGHLSEGLGCSVAEATKLKNVYLAAFPGIKDLQNTLKQRAKEGLPIYTFGGRQYHVEPAKYVEKFDRVMEFSYKLLNVLVQSSSADLTKEAVIKFAARKTRGRIILTVHDEIVVSAPKECAVEVMQVLKECMNDAGLDVPMLSDGEKGLNWGSMKPWR